MALLRISLEQGFPERKGAYQEKYSLSLVWALHIPKVKVTYLTTSPIEALNIVEELSPLRTAQASPHKIKHIQCP